jgi:predicted HicB family RNase H-like nuclease
MHLDGYVQALRDDLAAVAAVGDESTARAAQLLAVALESAFGRRLLEALNEAALELGSQVRDARVEVRLSGGDPELVVVEEEQDAPASAGDETYDARITLRLPESLKGRVEQAAAREGVSANTWIVNALSRNSAEPRRSVGGRRMTGFGKS